MAYQSLSIQDFYGRQVPVVLDEKIPDNCPLCHTSILPKRHQIALVKPKENPDNHVEIVYQCTSCQSLFIGIYTYSHSSPTANCFEFDRLTPTKPNYTSFSDEIRTVSPTFVEIYNQALSAEASGLNQLTGIGLRKAVEFLVKDFASLQHPNDVSDIQKAPLGKCIDKYIDDPRIKDCVKRAVWLGNDETHYIKKWEDKDIKDLKLLIRLTINWIENVLLTEKYKQVMPG